MAQPTSNPKIEELRFRIKTDPKSRLFYPLAEELRKINQWDESEHVLRTGLEHHPTYLSAWVSLGRVLRDQHKDADAIDALEKALQLDPGNVVAARLLGDSYLTTGDKVEAIKKYKLVLALMGDQEVAEIIAGLDRELNPTVPAIVAAQEPLPDPDPRDTPVDPLTIVTDAAAAPLPLVDEVSPFDETGSGRAFQNHGSAARDESTPFPIADHPMDETRPHARSQQAEESPWSEAPAAHLPTIETPFLADEPPATQRSAQLHLEPSGHATGDEEPMRLEHGESPFEDAGGSSFASLTIENPSGMHVEDAPAGANERSSWSEPAASFAPGSSEGSQPSQSTEPGGDSPSAWRSEPKVSDAANVFTDSRDQTPRGDDVTNTLTMADLYVRQGQAEQAKKIYERILEREPQNDAVRSKLAALTGGVPEPEAPAHDQRAEKLGRWLSKVGRREGGGV